MIKRNFVVYNFFFFLEVEVVLVVFIVWGWKKVVDGSYGWGVRWVFCFVYFILEIYCCFLNK